MGRECGWTRADLTEFTPHGLSDMITDVRRWRDIENQERAFPVAQFTALVRNMFLEKGEKPFTPADFIPGMQPQKKKQQTPEEMLAVVKMLNAAFGGEVIN